MPQLSPRALERRLKRHFLRDTHAFFAVCALGFEDLLEQELSQLEVRINQYGKRKDSLSPLLEITAKEPGGVSFTGPLELMYHTNLQLRTAHRILLRIDDFLAQSYPMLFNKTSKIPWELYLPEQFNIQVSSKSSRLHQHKNIAKTLNDAIQKRLEPLGVKSSLNEHAPLEIHVRLFQDRCTLSINTSGEHLHKRGYRTLTSDAPIRETLAAGLLQTLDLASFDLIIDPMCGSGTFPIEAALLNANLAPGLKRNFAFELLPGFQQSKWERFRRIAEQERIESKTTYLGFDIDAKAITSAKENAKQAGVAINFEVADTRDLKLPAQGKSLLISNVPYGERLEDTMLEEFARNIKKNFKGWSFGFVCKDTQWLKGFKIEQKKSFENGGMKVVWVTGAI
jgi:putative N6-adenine-specific DNA methylase